MTRSQLPTSWRALSAAVAACLAVVAMTPTPAVLGWPQDPALPASDPQAPEALPGAPEFHDKVPQELQPLVEEWRTWMRDTDPCEFGRALSEMPPCLSPENCAAYSLWQRRMPQGPMAALPNLEHRRRVFPTSGPVDRKDTPKLYLRLRRDDTGEVDELAQRLGEILERSHHHEAGDRLRAWVVSPEGDIRTYQVTVPDDTDEGALPYVEPEPRWGGWPGTVPCPADR